MSQFDGTGEKRRDGGDSGAFRGRRHPFLDRSIDWKAIDKARQGSEVASDAITDAITDRTALPREVDFEIIGDQDPSNLRVQACVAAVKKLPSDSSKWEVIRDCLIKEYRSAGANPSWAERAVMDFISAVNRRLGKAGNIEARKLSGEKAAQAAQAEGVACDLQIVNPPLTLSVRVRHASGFFGPRNVCFTPAEEA